MTDIIKTCMNCHYRDGVKFEHSRCLLSGFFCQVERKFPGQCGKDFNGWIQESETHRHASVTIIQKIIRIFK